MRNFGFGFMRLPMLETEEVDTAKLSAMVDLFLSEGFTYFDTAHGYVGGKSEIALKECLTSRYPREAYVLTDKLTGAYFEKEADILPLFENQLELTGVSYFDYYLLHALTQTAYDKFIRCKAFDAVKKLKAEGKIKHIGISFHDKPAVLEKILTENPEIEVVQIQFNYADYDNPSIESYAVYKVCEKFGKPVIVMEPCKGGGLVNLPDEAKAILDALGSSSYASYCIRYAASFPNIFMVLSGMSNLEQMRDNLGFMKEFKPFTDEEFSAVKQVRKILNAQDSIACTACRYCVDGCPKHISIPELFGCYNAKKQFKDWNSDFYYNVNTSMGKGKASDCIKCGKCEKICPQHLPIRHLLEQTALTFEKAE